MATLKIFAIRDAAADAFNRPYCAPTAGFALRLFVDEANNPQSQINKHPTDYELFELGEFDEQTAQMLMLPTPRSVGRAVDHIQQEPPRYDIPQTRQ